MKKTIKNNNSNNLQLYRYYRAYNLLEFRESSRFIKYKRQIDLTNNIKLLWY